MKTKIIELIKLNSVLPLEDRLPIFLGHQNVFISSNSLNTFFKYFFIGLNGQREIALSKIENMRFSMFIFHNKSNLEKFYNRIEAIKYEDLIDFIYFLISNATKTNVILSCLVILDKINYNKNIQNDKLNTLLLVLFEVDYFKEFIIKIFVNHSEYYESLYNTYLKVIESNNYDCSSYFYFGKLFTSSINYKLLHNTDFLNNFDLIDTKDDFDNENIKIELIKIIEEYNKETLKYSDILSLSQKMNILFEDKKNPVQVASIFIEIFLKRISYDVYPIALLMNLLICTENPYVYCFALASSFLITYENYDLLSYIKIISTNRYIFSITQRLLLTYDNVNNVFIEIFNKSNDIDIKIECLKNLKLGTKVSLKILMNIYKSFPNLRYYTSTTILNNLNLFNLLDRKLNDKEAQFIIDLISYSIEFPGDDNKLCFNYISNFEDILIKLYENYVFKNLKLNAHYLNALIIRVVDKKVVDNLNRIYDLIWSHIIVEDEYEYIEETINQKDFKHEEIVLLMNLYNYCPVERVKNLLLSNPNKYLTFISTLDYYLDEDEMCDILNYINDNFIFDVKYSYNRIDDDSEDLLISGGCLALLCEKMSKYELYLDKIICAGLQHNYFWVRELFYVYLNQIDNDFINKNVEIVDILTENLNFETDELALNLINKLLENDNNYIN